jgi:hypothetical protein
MVITEFQKEMLRILADANGRELTFDAMVMKTEVRDYQGAESTLRLVDGGLIKRGSIIVQNEYMSTFLITLRGLWFLFLAKKNLL